jgi:asparagine synthase (glutamine-hydrolysing)
MCGIVGAFGPDSSKAYLDNSLKLLINRGPDSNLIVRPNDFIALGATRLAMTDPLPRSNQPFNKGENWLVFNGEIYNHNELREWLQNSKGVTFKTNSDTEVLLEILRIFGADGTQYLNGMFAFAYFDHKSKKVILGRDRLGKKPLFYCIVGQNLYWASTLASLRKLMENDGSSIDENSVRTYLAFGYTIDTPTIYKEIQAIKPGFNFEFQAGSSPQSSEIGEFKTINQPISPEMNFYDAIQASVRDRIEGHNRVAVSLSGGIDSSVVARIASESESEVVAYSLKWGDSDKSRYNTDSQRAEQIAKNLELKFVEVDFRSDENYLEETLRSFVSLMGEPNSNPTGLSLIWLYRRIASDGFRLVLTGDGSDEILGGYPRYESPLLQDGYRFLNQDAYILLIRLHPILGKLGLRFVHPSSPAIWANFHWNFNPIEIEQLLIPVRGAKDTDISQHLFSLIQKASGSIASYQQSSALSTVMNRDSDIWLNNESNRKLDRISMAFSIEARSPFQDERVIKTAQQYMRKHGFKSHDKQLLRELFPELCKAGVRDDKAGFISPVGHWMRTNPQVVRKGLQAVSSSGLFKAKEIERRKNDQFSGDFTRIRQLWSLVVLGYWFLDSFGK